MKTTFHLFATALLLASTGSALAEVHYVDLNSTNATPPYTNWATAATWIQDAVSAAIAGDEVVVTNGTYGPVEIANLLTVRSVNGPHFTTLSGDHNVRCAYLSSGASLSGFTLINGDDRVYGGGGVFCQSLTSVVSNCVIAGNRSTGSFPYHLNAAGGGAYGGTLYNCTLSNNLASVSYAGGSVLLAYGGGACGSTLNNCTLTSNSVSFDSGSWNANFSSRAAGGGAYGCILNNCTLAGNRAFAHSGSGSYGAVGGGAYGGTLNNSVVYFNNSLSAPNYASPNLNYCCTTPQPATGVGNITHAPLFVDTNGWADLRLQLNSPCINAGNNSYLTYSTFTNCFDLDGNPRIVGGTVDIGAYEFQSPVSQISYAWLQQYGLPINASTDTDDPDGDAVDNYHEWLAGTDPTNSLSSPAQVTITPCGVPPSGIVLTWSTNAVGFTLQSTTNLLSPASWVTNSPAPVIVNGQNTVTNLIFAGQQFYRLILN